MKKQNDLKRTLSQPESIVMIQQLLESQANLGRTKFAEYVCEHFKFHNAHGKPQTDNCMKALRDLEKVHDFILPAPRFTSKRKRNVKRLGHAVDLPVEVPAKSCEVLGLHLIQVSNDAENLIWNELMMREHPKKAGIMVGAQLRYLIASEHGWLGGFGFAASALTLRDRDRWIGWDHSIRREYQFRVVNMSRFLIRPSVHCRNLASHCMSMALRRVAIDFETRYGYQPWLLESLVDESVHSGACYKASNWIRVGQTQGRGRNDINNKKRETIKGIYLYPLIRNFRQQMGVVEPEAPPSLAVSDGLGTDVWAQNEFGGADLGDKRLNNRLVQVARIQAEKPTRAFCGAAEGNQAVVKGYYRMIEQPDDSAVTMEAILAPHRRRTIERMRFEKIVLNIQDGTDLNFNSLAQCEDLGMIGNNQTGASSKGLHLHSTFVVNTDGLPLGVLRADCNPPLAKSEHTSSEDKKTSHWIEATHDCNALAKILPDTQQICVMDREADFFELFEQARHKRVDLLVRAKHNRKTDGKQKLFDSVRASPVCGQASISVPRQSARPKLSKQKAHSKRDERTAVVDMRYQAIEMRVPGTAEHKDKAAIQLWMVHIREQSPPPDEKGVEWFLLTTWPITCMEQAEECLRWYKLRWRIEDWHRVLKSGCKVGSLAYKSATRLKRGIAINMVIAWRIMLMTLLGRECPNLPAEILFSDTEIKVLNAYALKKTLPDHASLVMQSV